MKRSDVAGITIYIIIMATFMNVEDEHVARIMAVPVLISSFVFIGWVCRRMQ